MIYQQLFYEFVTRREKKYVSVKWKIRSGPKLLKESVEKFFTFVTDSVYRAICVASVSAVYTDQNLGSEAVSVRFSVVGAAPTPISLLEPSVYMCFDPLFSLSMTYLYLFW